MPGAPMAAVGLILAFVYIAFLILMIGGYIYMLVKIGAISRDVASIAAQQERQSFSLASMADSVAVIARNSAAPKSVPPHPLEI